MAIKSKSNKTAQLWGELVVTVFRLNALFIAKGNEIARPAGQTTARWQVLASAYRAPLTVSQIARRMGMSRQSIQRTADLLVGEKLATYIENKNHKKAKLVMLTAKGRRAMEMIAAEQLVYATKWGNKIPAKEVASTLESLARIEQACRD